VTSSNPAQPQATWSVARIERPDPDPSYLTAVSCPSATMCVAVDASGRAIASRRPTRGSAAWTVTEIDGSKSLRGISCPDRRLCVAVDDDGDVIASTNPSAKRSGWTITHIPATQHLTGVSCATPRLCVATGAAAHGGTLLRSRAPAAGVASWELTKRPDNTHAFHDVACPSPQLCIGIGDDTLVTIRRSD
jgi:hypothetical protein